MTRGFVTIATGDSHYYMEAANLLASYRYFTANPIPFALLCDEQNQYTEQFDDVIVMENPHRSYLDKLSLPVYAPYDETIFIDADCLAYRDLNDFWDYFEGADDFTAFGLSFPPHHKKHWFKREDVGEYGDRISFIPEFMGHVYFIRKTERLAEFTRTCSEILERYGEFKFRLFDEPADEPIFALAMALHGFRPVDRTLAPICFLPFATYFRADISEGIAEFVAENELECTEPRRAYLVHWTNLRVGKPGYLLEVARLHHVLHSDDEAEAWAAFAKTVYPSKEGGVGSLFLESGVG